MLTIPRSLFKSYTKDLSLPIFELVIQHRLQPAFVLTAVPSQCYDLGQPEDCLYLLMITSGKASISPLSSMDSGLEAFSRNPTHGSFSALTFQSTEFANYVNQRFLSY